MTRILELFPGAGGLAEGFRRAGMPVTLAVDWDRHACATYARNVGPHVVRADVRSLPVAASWAPDLIVADPPCQPWSTAGKRAGLEDPRDMLRPTVDIVLRLRPAGFLLGNVPGLETGPARPQLEAAVLAPLRAAGYCVHESGRLDCARYGVAQRRIRPWWYFHRAGRCITWPRPTHAPPSELADLRRTLPLFGPRELLPWITVRQALSVLPREEWGSPVRGRVNDDRNGRHGGSQSNRATSEDRPADTVQGLQHRGHVVRIHTESHHRAGFHRGQYAAPADRPAQAITCEQHMGHLVDVSGRSSLERHPASTLDAPAFTVLAGTHGAPGCALLSLPAWCDEHPATTIYAGTSQLAAPGNGSPMSRGPYIRLSERAAALLQGFPLTWDFCGPTKTARWRQLGNAMPPPMAEHIARAVRATLASTVAQEVTT